MSYHYIMKVRKKKYSERKNKKMEEEDGLMKSKRKLLIAAAAAVVLLAFNVYDRFILTPARLLDFTISPVTVFCGFAGRPLFWMLMGFLASFLLAGRFASAERKSSAPMLLMGSGLLMMILYAGMVIWYAAASGGISVGVVSGALMWLVDNPLVFLVPGVLIGAGRRGLYGTSQTE